MKELVKAHIRNTTSNDLTPIKSSNRPIKWSNSHQMIQQPSNIQTIVEAIKWVRRVIQQPSFWNHPIHAIRQINWNILFHPFTFIRLN